MAIPPKFENYLLAVTADLMMYSKHHRTLKIERTNISLVGGDNELC